MSKAFLSHSSSNKDLVEKIAKQLGKDNCHYDSLTFEAGHQTLDEIFKGLEDTDIFVLFISEKSLESDWVKKEITGAKKLLGKNVIERIFPLIIDKTISHNDPRIPDWVKKPYNIRYFENEVLILKKIRQFLRESNFRKFSHLRELNDLFVGRHDLMQEFERKLVTIDNTKPTCIIASSFFDGIGRRTVLRNGLIKTGIIDKWYEPIPISISAKESIEDFIYKLSFIESSKEIFKHDFTAEELDAKIDLVKKLIKHFIDNKEVILIVDEGSIVLPNHTLVDWFLKVLTAPELQNQVSILLVSKFRPYVPLIKKLKNVVSFTVEELTSQDTQTFFIQYLNHNRQELTADDIRFFLPFLKGIPSQIIYAANLIESLGAPEAKRYVQDIEEFDELRALSVFDYLKGDELSKQILIALSRFEIVSHDLVYKIFGENEEVYKSIQKLFDLSLFFFVSSTHEYLKLNSSLADYINRSRITLSSAYEAKIKEITREAIQKPIELNEETDYSEFLLTLQTMIQQNISIPKKYLIPSFLLKTIIKEYYAWNFKTVIQLSKKIIENESKFDRQIIRETRNWLCLAYCRTRDDLFFEEVRYFKDEIRETETLKDYHFLLGFYYRNADRMEEAEEYFLKVLDQDSYHSKAKRELVNVYLRTGEYSKALNWAAENYERQRTNILHIQAYFTCLIKKEELVEEDIVMLKELMTQAKKSLDKKADDIAREMHAEFNFYVDGRGAEAISSMREALKLNGRNYFAFRALLEMYKAENNLTAIDKLIAEYPHLTGNDD